MTEPHDHLWCEWLGAWHDADASKPKPSYEGWLEKRLEAAEKAWADFKEHYPWDIQPWDDMQMTPEAVWALDSLADALKETK
jgi:hypothetical protein